MRTLLLGANGQVGFELARSLAPLGKTSQLCSLSSRFANARSS